MELLKWEGTAKLSSDEDEVLVLLASGDTSSDDEWWVAMVTDGEDGDQIFLFEDGHSCLIEDVSVDDVLVLLSCNASAAATLESGIDIAVQKTRGGPYIFAEVGRRVENREFDLLEPTSKVSMGDLDLDHFSFFFISHRSFEQEVAGDEGLHG